MDISDSLAPASDQLDAIELVAGPRTFEVERVTKNNADQPINVHLVNFPRPWRPSKGMRRVLAAGWGVDASKWTGRRVTLFFDPSVTFGKDTPGGTRIKEMSHLDGPLRVPLLVSRGKSATFTVQPLATEPTVPLADLRAQVAAATNPDDLRALWPDSGPEVRELIKARVEALTKPDTIFEED